MMVLEPRYEGYLGLPVPRSILEMNGRALCESQQHQEVCRGNTCRLGPFTLVPKRTRSVSAVVLRL